MATYIEMPKLSDTMTEGKLLKWLKKEGDVIAAGDELAEVETDKATMAMESFEDGILHKIYVTEGGTAVVGGALALLLEEGEDAPADADSPPAPPAAPVEEEKDTPAEEAPSEKAASPDAGSTTNEGSSSPPASASAGTGPATGAAVSADPNRRVKSSPLARKLAAERGVDLRTVVGTGPGGRVTKADVLRGPVPGITVGAPASGAGGGAASGPAIRPEAGPDDERLPLSGMRKIIAERLLASKRQIPHFYLNVEIDAGPLMKLRSQVNAEADSGKEGANKYTVNDFVLKGVADAAVAVPAVNASFDGDAVVQFKSIGLGVAVAVEDGLLTPVILNAGDRTLLEISREMKDIATKARSKKLSPDSFKGGTITVSNLGGMGIDSFDAIVNPPQSIIVSIGSIVKKPVVDADGEIVPGLRMWIGMSCDHRVVDGAVGAAYLAELRKFLENPALMLV